VKIQDQTDAMATAQWECREDEPVRDAVGMDHIDRLFAINAEQFACGQNGESAVLDDVGANPRPLMALDWLAVELRPIKLATSRIAVTLQGDDADPPSGGNGGAGGATNAWVLIYIGVHHER
jgi:hypothetical protein